MRTNNLMHMCHFRLFGLDKFLIYKSRKLFQYYFFLLVPHGSVTCFLAKLCNICDVKMSKVYLRMLMKSFDVGTKGQ